MAAGSTIDALGQFELHPVLGGLGESLRFSQSPVMMIVASVLVLAFLYVGMRPAAIVPGRLQAAAEICYDFIHDMAVDTIGPEGRAFFPFIFTLFFFILAGNYLGLLPFSFAFTSHIAVTLALALLVFVLAVIVSLKAQGPKFFAHFMPAGAPVALAPLLVPIEILSFLSRPVSLSIRLFANMVAGHVMLEMFAAFTIMLAGLGLFGDVLAVGPVVINVALMALELLVGALQAYVFAILTCIYLREAVAH
ncbi:ATP synthase F0, A subunit [Gluconacetobacter diazotrophicus PA1 5]|uniref:ATP synthase subunit a n=2 Tax=Gluconacetobacter diazotrophicus TaxID=33996 RepID=ATP6_GLUDA|nr:F0F1 ATP synthase subunit A [Gluconacetobacter diazotrophicus]A9HDN1.1 RecName: Full=ATP synthase subunit a; AltName: Full=ATP synthase F0 sector subunit a; AltName: Full=F-ATPase subunit 6 [Gluconacetobacter diazotrophicus PA1 5]ACI51653.1 ATP synthase F0, A subunit [Gluconacetobacter diazotrophicus PA1 5]MBB2155315.1 F0F1 ATP synthase subunit A [Gluconacetobacter diazotrophicus]TWB10997.1 ATP synthase F0 subcomplex A subunit [Gluconacetobacter diazotrophicus]CAP55123.1 putative ATP syntha